MNRLKILFLGILSSIFKVEIQEIINGDTVTWIFEKNNRIFQAKLKIVK